MPETLRAFVAVPVEPTPSFRRILERLRKLGGSVKASDPDHLHLTLKFLGDVSWTSMADITKVLTSIASRHSPHQVEMTSLQAFPNPQRPRVIWTSLTPVAGLCELAGELNDRLGALGFPREQRAFVPHVTLARIKGRPPGTLFQLLEESEPLHFGGLSVDRMILFQSTLGKSGPKYVPLSEHDLQ